MPRRRLLWGIYTRPMQEIRGLKKGESIWSKGAYFWELTVYFVYLYDRSPHRVFQHLYLTTFWHFSTFWLHSFSLLVTQAKALWNEESRLASDMTHCWPCSTPQEQSNSSSITPPTSSLSSSLIVLTSTGASLALYCPSVSMKYVWAAGNWKLGNSSILRTFR